MRALLLITTILLTLNAHAQNFTWNGVFTQGFIHTDDNNLYGKSEDNVSLDFTEFSLNGSYNLPKSIRISAQVIYRHGGAGFDGVNLDYLFVDHQFLTTQKSIGGARLGRIKFPVGLYNDTRDIAFTRPSIYLSQAIYFDLSDRDAMLSGDGLELYLSHFTDFGSFTSSFSYVFIDEDALSNQEQDFPRNTKLYIEDGVAYRVHYDSLEKKFRIAFSGNYTDSFGSRVGVFHCTCPNFLTNPIMKIGPISSPANALRLLPTQKFLLIHAIKTA